MGLIAALMLCHGTASAQGRVADDRPTAGPALPWVGPLSSPSALQVLTGPASLAHLKSWELAVAHAELDTKGIRGGTGTALLFAQGLDLLPLSYGLALFVTRWPPAFSDAYGLTLGITGAVAYRVAWWLGLGMSLTHFQAVDGALAHTTTMDLSLLATPSRFFGLSVTAHDIFMPGWADGLPLQRTWDFDLGFRPFGSDRLTLSAGVTLGERRGTADPRLRIEASVWRSLKLVAEATYRHRAWDMDRDGTEEVWSNELRGTLALSLDFEHWGGGAAVMLGRADPSLPGRTYQGVAAYLQYRHRAGPSVSRPSNRVLVVSIAQAKSETAFTNLLLSLAEAERDERIAAVLFKIPDGGTSWARADELRSAASGLRRRGKFVAAILRSPSNKAYYIAASMDAVWMDPSGTAMLSGLAARRLYFQKTLERIGVTVEVLRNGPYKTAPNSLTRTTPSKEEDEVVRSILTETDRRFRRALAHRGAVARSGGPDKVLAESPAVPPKAKRLGLVDAVYTSGQVESALKQRCGNDLRFVKPTRRSNRHWGRRDALAVIVVEGDLVSGKSGKIPLLGERLAGHQTILEQIRKAKQDPRIKAVVLRINSPGGQAEAADEIWRALMDLRKTKPVIASLGSIAASGGYEIAAGARKIFCEPGTLTGSVGIFIAKPVVLSLLEKLGIGLAEWKRGPHTGLMSPLVALNSKERERMRSRLLYHYHRFLDAVAKGRNMPMAKVKRAAGGRLWTCRQALAHGLTDQRGGLIAALAEARKRAGLPWDSPVLVWPRSRKSLTKWLLTKLLTRKELGITEADLTGKILAPILPLLEALPPSLLTSRGTSLQARLPFRLEIQ